MIQDRPWIILLVEDDEDDFILTRDALARARGSKFDLLWVRSYEEALKVIARKPPDAVLVDYRLGKQTGLDLVREMAQRGNKVPIIVLTGQGSYEIDLEAMKMGASDYLDKRETTPALLERTIRYAIERRLANEELGQRADHIEVQHHLMHSGEMERLHIAQDLHDGPLQMLIGISYSLRDLLDNARDDTSIRKINTLQAILGQQIVDLRTYCSELRPPTLVPYGLEKAIRSHVENFEKIHTEIKIHANLARDGQSLPEPVRLALFRIYQELMNNVVRHSQASEGHVTFQLDGQWITLEVSDNGCGFDVPKNWLGLARQGHLGLVGIRERAEAIGGMMEIDSQPGEGTRVQVRVPTSSSDQQESS